MTRSVKRLLRATVDFVEAALVLLVRYPLSFLQTRFGTAKTRLQVGSGNNKFAGWYNGDITWDAEVIAYMGRKLPFASESLSFVHSEHAIEHVPRDAAIAFLKEVRRVLKPGGVCRIGTPDLAAAIGSYVADDWRKWGWVHEHGHDFIDSRARMINASFYWWGHRFLYDRPELERLCREAGFETLEFVELGESRHPELRNLETREHDADRGSGQDVTRYWRLAETAAARSSVLIGNLAITLMTARMLGPDGRGGVVQVMVWATTLGGFVNLSVGQLLQRRIQAGRDDWQRRIIAPALIIFAAMVIVGELCLWGAVAVVWPPAGCGSPVLRCR